MEDDDIINGDTGDGEPTGGTEPDDGVEPAEGVEPTGDGDGQDGGGDAGDGDSGEEAGGDADDGMVALPVDSEGSAIHVGDVVLVRARNATFRVASLTIDSESDAIDGEAVAGWKVHARALSGGTQSLLNVAPANVKVVELTPEMGLLVDFYDEASRNDELWYKILREYAERVSLA